MEMEPRMEKQPGETEHTTGEPEAIDPMIQALSSALEAEFQREQQGQPAEEGHPQVRKGKREHSRLVKEKARKRRHGELLRTTNMAMMSNSERHRHHRKRQTRHPQRPRPKRYDPIMANLATNDEPYKNPAGHIGRSLACLQFLSIAFGITSLVLSILAFQHDQQWNQYVLSNKDAFSKFMKSTNNRRTEIGKIITEFKVKPNFTVIKKQIRNNNDMTTTQDPMTTVTPEYEEPEWLETTTQDYNKVRHHKLSFYIRDSDNERIYIWTTGTVLVLSLLGMVLEILCYKRASRWRSLITALGNVLAGISTMAACVLMINSISEINQHVFQLTLSEKMCYRTKSIYCFCLPNVHKQYLERHSLQDTMLSRWIQEHHTCQLGLFKFCAFIISWFNSLVYLIIAMFAIYYYVVTKPRPRKVFKHLNEPTNGDIENALAVKKKLIDKMRKSAPQESSQARKAMRKRGKNPKAAHLPVSSGTVGVADKV